MAIQFKKVSLVSHSASDGISRPGGECGAEPRQTPSVKKKKRGRPKTGFDKLDYNRKFMADKRAASKLGISVKQYREGKR